MATFGGPAEHEIVNAYLNDARFDFKERGGGFLRGGLCPACHKKELWISKQHPWILRCSRLNNCGYEATTREIYPELFEDYTKRHPPTPADPNATARAYLSHNRGFPLDKISGWYEQGHYRDQSGQVFETVRVYLDDDRTRYWERLIDKRKDQGQRINFGGKRKPDGSVVKGDWWTPPGQELKTGDEVFLVEGIFHAIAFHLAGYKTAALLMAGNFPEEAIKPHLKQSIKWRVALDDDKAGRKHALSHYRKLKAMDESVQCVLSGQSRDWDDIYRLEKLNNKLLAEGLFRGRLFTAESITRKAWIFHQWKGLRVFVLPHEGKLHGVEIDSDKMHAALTADGLTISHPGSFEIFAASAAIAPISNCVPEFLYTERNRMTQEIAYFFKVEYAAHPGNVMISLSGSAIESAPAFNKALLTTAGSATFDGKPTFYKLIRERWFRQKSLEVETLPFVGYDRDTEAYLFKSFGFFKNQEMRPNEHGFFEFPKPIKTGFRGFDICRGDDAFNTAWFGDFIKVFGLNGLTCLVFFFGSLFAEQVRELQKSFPFLEITGEHGTGKSTLIEFLWKLLGRDDHEGFDPSKATFAARARTFSQASNFPVVLIESDRGGEGSKVKQFDFEELKTAYNGRAIRSTGVFNRGNDTEEPPFRGTVVISQNAQVDGTPALLSRIIRTHFTSKHFTEETKRLAPTFESSTVENMSGFLLRALGHERQILETYKTARHTYDDYFTRLEVNSQRAIKDQRIVKNHASLMALAEALQLIIPEFSNELLDELTDHVFQLAQERQAALSSDHPIVQSFWETYDLLNDQVDAKGLTQSVIEILNHSHDTATIAINLKHFEQVCADQKVERLPTADLKKYLTGSKKHRFIEQKNVRSKILNKSLWCWIFSATVDKH